MRGDKASNAMVLALWRAADWVTSCVFAEYKEIQRMKINCIDNEIKQILEGGFYRIPRFQRPYLWEKEQVEDFWNDTIAGTEQDYFIGSMVVFKTGDVYGVVDGQQRLTTISMILAA